MVPVYVLAKPQLRFFATIMDNLLVGVISGLLAKAVLLRLRPDHDSGLIVMFVVSAILIGYFGLILARHNDGNGQTIGKACSGMRIVRVNGRPVTFAIAIWREWICKTMLLDVGIVIYLYTHNPLGMTVGALYVGLDCGLVLCHRLALHDRLAATRVIFVE